MHQKNSCFKTQKTPETLDFTGFPVFFLSSWKRDLNPRPLHYWEVAGVQHKMKLNTGMITKLENKYRTNIMTLVTANDIPPLGVMLTIAQAAIEPWEHGTTFDKVTKLYDKWLEEGGNQFDFMAKVIMPTMAVSGFFTPAMAESLMKDLDQADVIL